MEGTGAVPDPARLARYRMQSGAGFTSVWISCNSGGATEKRSVSASKIFMACPAPDRRKLGAGEADEPDPNLEE